MRILVTGGRGYADRDTLNATLSHMQPTAVICGGASGADALAADWAVANGVALIEFYADWRAHDKAAGPLRNQRMLTEGKPDRVVAFPGGRGTRDMVRKARRAGVEIYEVTA